MGITDDIAGDWQASLAALAQNQVVVIPGAVNLEMVRGALQRQLGSLQ